ncbi:hypothetical protein SAMN05428985_104448 [Nocardioides sp. YR527]|uniref:hypothetical protein n=1 Tax=Nocardioides sp. YR527 TaxID=1881028 RepID=UPI00088644AF|nr:hypothetical protein [Nocardioides sp. YR527]SDK54720.1 hypothetical protein SAMN05428985_104448 [Nocardioides sp. YR527]
MTLPEPLDAARDLVGQRFPAATQAWLGGSVILGEAGGRLWDGHYQVAARW